MTSRILSETRDEAQELFSAGAITQDKFDHMMQLTARNLKVPKPIKFSGKRIAKIRKKLHCSQKIFADIIGVSSDTISRWERGEREPEKPVCRFLKVLEREGLAAVE